jgi:hypothetical protein
MGPLCGAGQERDDKAVVVLGRIAVLLTQLAAWPLVIPALACWRKVLRKIPPKPVLWAGLLGSWLVTDTLRHLGLLHDDPRAEFIVTAVPMAICGEVLLAMRCLRTRREAREREEGQEEWRSGGAGHIVAERRAAMTQGTLARDAEGDAWVVGITCRQELCEEQVRQCRDEVREVWEMMRRACGESGLPAPAKQAGRPVLTLLHGGKAS